jgi:hypothetical protein
MESENLWVVVNWEGVNVSFVGFDGSVLWCAVDARVGELVTIFESLGAAVLYQRLYQADSIVVVSDSASIVDMASNEDQSVPRNLVLVI